MSLFVHDQHSRSYQQGLCHCKFNPTLGPHDDDPSNADGCAQNLRQRELRLVQSQRHIASPPLEGTMIELVALP